MATQGSKQEKEGSKPAEERNRDLGKGRKPEPLPGQTDGVENEYEQEKREARETGTGTQPSQPSQQGNVNRPERPGDAVPGDDEETANRSGRNREGVE
jgi:hypothetical protein